MRTTKAVSRSILMTTTIPLALLVACGGTKPEPVASTPPPVDTAAAVGADAAAEEPTSAGHPAAPSTSPEAAAPSTEAAPAPESPKPGVVIGEMKDECTPVGVEFEKRARPKLKECYAQGKKKSPNLEGTVKIKITVDVKGKIKSTKVVEKTLPDPVADCMLKVIKATPFPEVEKCWDASITIPVTFPTPK